KRRRRLDCHSSSPLLGTAEPSYPVSLSPSREATALVTAPAEGWAAGPPGLVAAVASARSQTAWAMRCSGRRTADHALRSAPGWVRTSPSRSDCLRTACGSWTCPGGDVARLMRLPQTCACSMAATAIIRQKRGADLG